MTDAAESEAAARARGRAMILPLALAQFIASYAATNMNVAISAIAKDLGTDVAGVQTAITLFTLTMAALDDPGQQADRHLGPQTAFPAASVVSRVPATAAGLRPLPWLAGLRPLARLRRLWPGRLGGCAGGGLDGRGRLAGPGRAGSILACCVGMLTW